jgi:hypothetical protein
MNTLEQWIEQKRRRQMPIILLLASLAFLAGLLVLFLTFWLLYALLFVMGWGVSAIVELFASREFMIPHFWRLLLAGAWLIGVCFGYACNPMSNMDPIPARDYVGWSPTFHGGGTAAGLVMLAAYPGATAHLLRDLFQTGPRLIHGALALGRMYSALKAIQPSFCAIFLERLVRAGGAVTWDELQNIHGPEYLEAAVIQLRSIDGVILIEKGLTLPPELRRELRPMLALA